MDIMQSFVMTSCALSIIFSIISMVADTSKFEKEFKFLLVSIYSIVLLKAILQLNLSIFEGVSLSENPYTTQTSIEDYTLYSYRVALESSIEELLTSNGVVCKNISTDINISQESCISINRVYILVDNFSYAKRLILENFGDLNVENLGGD